MNTDLIATFEAMKPGIAAEYAQYVTATLAELLTKYSAGSRRELLNEWGRDGHMWRSLRHLTTYPTDERGIVVKGSEAFICANRVNNEAKAYADQQVDSFIAKLTKKLGAVQNVEVKHISTGSFECVITGTLKGTSVRLHQNRVLNCSPKGKVFHQWPALIYVNGDRMTEAAFKKWAA